MADMEAVVNVSEEVAANETGSPLGVAPADNT